MSVSTSLCGSIDFGQGVICVLDCCNCMDEAVISTGAALHEEQLLVLRYLAEQDHLDCKKSNSV